MFGLTTRSRFRTPLALAAVALVAAACDKETTAPGKVAAGNVSVAASAATLRAIEGTAFSFPATAGAVLSPALANKAFTLTFTNTSAATPTATFVVAGTGQFAATTTFGSCIFAITSSTIPGVTVGQTITVNPCQYNVATGGVQATGNATTVQILLQLGIVPSAANQASVSINPTTGVVTVNNVNTGTSVTLTIATGAGS